MAVITDLPNEYRRYMRTLNKGVNKIIDAVADPVMTSEQKVNRINTVFHIMDKATQQSNQILLAGATDTEAEIDLIV